MHWPLCIDMEQCFCHIFWISLPLQSLMYIASMQPIFTSTSFPVVCVMFNMMAPIYLMEKLEASWSGRRLFTCDPLFNVLLANSFFFILWNNKTTSTHLFTIHLMSTTIASYSISCGFLLFQRKVNTDSLSCYCNGAFLLKWKNNFWTLCFW